MEAQKRKRIVPKQRVDRRLLEQELAKRGETFCSASKRLGFTNSYFSTMLSPNGKRDELPRHTIIALFAKFGISAETITPGYEPPKDEPISEKPKKEPKQDDLAGLIDSTRAENGFKPLTPIELNETPDAVTKAVSAIYELIRAAAHDGCAQAIKELL